MWSFETVLGGPNSDETQFIYKKSASWVYGTEWISLPSLLKVKVSPCSLCSCGSCDRLYGAVLISVSKLKSQCCRKTLPRSCGWHNYTLRDMEQCYLPTEVPIDLLAFLCF